jgi:hypothetical protein
MNNTFFLVIRLKNAPGVGDYANPRIAMCLVVFYNSLLLHVFFYKNSGIIIANTKVA